MEQTCQQANTTVSSEKKTLDAEQNVQLCLMPSNLCHTYAFTNTTFISQVVAMTPSWTITATENTGPYTVYNHRRLLLPKTP